MASKPLLDGAAAQGRGNFFTIGDPRILGWIKEAIEEGERINRNDPAFPKMDEAMAYVLGDQLRGMRPTYLPNVIINQTKKAIRTHVAALTDIRPLFMYRTMNPQFEPQSHVLNKRIVAWWVNTFADLEIADVIKYALTAGAGDVLVEWDDTFQDGENRLVPRDPRDTIPVRPSRSRSIQDWEGVVIREAMSPNQLRAKYPEYADAIIRDTAAGSRWGQLFTRFMRSFSVSTPMSTLDGLRAGKQATRGMPELLVYRCYLKDRSINLNTKAVLLGKPGTNWCYSVEPGQPLYPRGRLIVATETSVMYDGPNPYWHGMFPVARLRLDPWPWVFFGLGLAHDLMPLQNAINTTTNDLLNALSQHVNRGIIADSKAMPEPMLRRMDTRKPNWKARVNATFGDSFKMAEGPNIPPWAFNLLNMMVQKHEDLAEMANLQQLAQLRQMPSGDTIEKYYEALTPGLRQEGRLLEAHLREVAEMVKVNIFQFESQAKRVMILGDAGKTLQDFDMDPNTMVPAMKPTDPGYIPDLDADVPRDKRAQFFHKLFAFYIAPNSILAMHAQEEQMKYVQLARQGYMDFWSLMEMLEVPNVGAPPPIPLPLRDWNPAEHPGPGGVPTPAPLEMRVPITITERLQAQQMLGIGQTVSPVGRKASGEAPPQVESKDGGARQTVTESKKGGGKPGGGPPPPASGAPPR